MISLYQPRPNDIGCIKEVLTFGNEQVSVHHTDNYRKRTCFPPYNNKLYGYLSKKN
jgi:hypothetical protein